jgi:soluble lytic murein transglycosylase
MHNLKLFLGKCFQWTLIISIITCFVVIEPVYAKEGTKSKSTNSKSTKADSNNGELSNKDLLFIDLREAARKNDLLKAMQLASQLNDYPMQDYVEYFKLKPRLYDSAGQANADTDADTEVEKFLQRYKGSALADRVRNDWILVLGKRRDWTGVERHYSQFVLDDDTQVKCYSFIARLNRGENPKQVGNAAKAAILDSRYFGEACPLAVQALLE